MLISILVPEHLGEYDILLPIPHFDRVLMEKANVRVESAVNINIVRMLKRQAKIVCHSKALDSSTSPVSDTGKSVVSVPPPPLPSSEPSISQVRSASESESSLPGERSIDELVSPDIGQAPRQSFPHDATPTTVSPSMVGSSSEAVESSSAVTDRNKLQKKFTNIVDHLVSSTLNAAMGKPQPPLQTIVVSEKTTTTETSSSSGTKAALPSMTSASGDTVPPIRSTTTSSTTESSVGGSTVYNRLVKRMAADYAVSQMTKGSRTSLEKPRGSQGREADVVDSVAPTPSDGSEPAEDKKWRQLFNLAAGSINAALEGVSKQPVGRDIIMQVTVKEVNKERPTPLIAARAELLPTTPQPVRPSPVSTSATIPMRKIRGVYNIGDRRYVDKSLWIQQLAKKIESINVQSAPTEEPARTETTSGVEVTVTESASQQQMETKSTSILPAPGPNITEKIVSHKKVVGKERRGK